jgi:hypothetical protein
VAYVGCSGIPKGRTLKVLLSCTLPVSQKLFGSCHLLQNANPTAVADASEFMTSSGTFNHHQVVFLVAGYHGLRYYFSPKGWVRKPLLFSLWLTLDTAGFPTAGPLVLHLTKIQKLCSCHLLQNANPTAGADASESMTSSGTYNHQATQLSPWRVTIG